MKRRRMSVKIGTARLCRRVDDRASGNGGPFPLWKTPAEKVCTMEEAYPRARSDVGAGQLELDEQKYDAAHRIVDNASFLSEKCEEVLRRVDENGWHALMDYTKRP